MSKKLVLSVFAFILILAMGLPYGVFSWNTSAQSYGEAETDEEAAPPPSNVVNFSGQSISYFIEDGQLAVYGECLAVDGLCSRIALVNFNEVESGAVIYDGDITIRVFEIADGVWQINIYSEDELLDDKSEVYVNENGEAYLLVRRG